MANAHTRQEREAAVWRIAETGISVAAIALEFEVSEKTVRDWQKQFEIPLTEEESHLANAALDGLRAGKSIKAIANKLGVKTQPLYRLLHKALPPPAEDPPPEQLQAMLTQIRQMKNQDLSAWVIAARMNVSPITIGDWLTGRRRSSSDSLKSRDIQAYRVLIRDAAGLLGITQTAPSSQRSRCRYRAGL